MNLVVISGIVKDSKVDGFKILEFCLPKFNKDGQLTSRIQAKYWTMSNANIFTALKSGTKISLKGHLDSCKEFDTIIVVESFEQI